MADIKRKLGTKVKKTIPALSSLDVDTVDLSLFKRLLYHASFSGDNQVKGMDLNVINTSGQVYDSIFARIGDLPLQLTVLKTGSDAIVSVTNPNAFDIELDAIRFQF